MNARDILRGPHITSQIKRLSGAPVLITEPLRFHPVKYTQGNRRMSMRVGKARV